jgi:adenylate cyclase
MLWRPAYAPRGKVEPGMEVLLEGWGGDETLHARARIVEPFAFTKVSTLVVTLAFRHETRVDRYAPIVVAPPPMMKPGRPWSRLAESLLGEVSLTATEVAHEAGMEPALTRRLWRALGFPPVDDDERIFTRSDVEVLRTVRTLIELERTHVDDVVQLTRVIGQSLARLADAQVTAVADRLDQLRPASVPRATAVTELEHRFETLAPSLEYFLAYVWRRHVLAAVRQWSAAPTTGDLSLTIGFADLVGFTAMSESIAPHELAVLVDRFEALAYEHIPERGGRVVKMIGDEVMFAVEDAGLAADMAVALVEACARDPVVPEIRVGLAHGPTLPWEGDLYGPTVNLASRLVNLARPGTVLVADELGPRLADDPRFELRHLRPVRLHGLGRARPWVLRRARALA